MAQLQDIDLRQLIPPIRRMIAAMGLDKTLLLLEARGGTYISLQTGRQWRWQDTALSQLVGQEAADAFRNEFEGESVILLPKADSILRQVRDREIRAAGGEVSVRDLALRYGMSERQVYNIRAESSSEPGQTSPEVQGDLFD